MFVIVFEKKNVVLRLNRLIKNLNIIQIARL